MGAIRGAGDEPEESGAQFCGEKEKQDDVCPGVWHFRCFFPFLRGSGRRILAWGLFFWLRGREGFGFMGSGVGG